MKKPIYAVIAITVLCTSLFTGCAVVASSADTQPPTNSVSPQSNAPNVSTANDFTEILSLRTEGHYSLSLRDFNAAIKTKMDSNPAFLSTFSALMESVAPNEENYQFVYETLNYSISEIISPQMSQPVVLSRYLQKYGDEYAVESGETFYKFMFTALYSVEYRVADETLLTVQERDELLAAYQTELQNAISAMSKEQLTADGVKSELQKVADNLCADLSTDALVFENAEIQSIEILDGTKEYQK